MNIIDFAIGVLIVNSLAHFIFGITKTRYLGLFGYSPAGNIGYGVLQFVVAVVLLFARYSLESIMTNGFVLGGLFVLMLFLVFGRFSLKLFSKKE